MMQYTVEQLDRLILNATLLRFWDDVKYWRAIRSDLMAERRNAQEES